MILVDTSIWISHLKKPHNQLIQLLDSGRVACHEFVIGELACGNIGNRKEILSLLKAIPSLDSAQNKEVLEFIDFHKLSGQGLGLIDIYLLAACKLGHAKLWTLDKKLQASATKLKVAYAPQNALS